MVRGGCIGWATEKSERTQMRERERERKREIISRLCMKATLVLYCEGKDVFALCLKVNMPRV